MLLLFYVLFTLILCMAIILAQPLLWEFYLAQRIKIMWRLSFCSPHYLCRHFKDFFCQIFIVRKATVWFHSAFCIKPQPHTICHASAPYGHAKMSDAIRFAGRKKTGAGFWRASVPITIVCVFKFESEMLYFCWYRVNVNYPYFLSTSMRGCNFHTM